MPRPPAPADETRHEDPAEGSRKTIQRELERTGKRGKQSPTSDEEADADEKLDRAIEMTFPASDPPLPGSATGTEQLNEPKDRQSPRLTREEIDRASGRRSAANIAHEQSQMVPGDDGPQGTPGTGEDLCPMCRGRGKMEGGVCSNCQGKGKVIKGIGGA